MHKPKKNTQYNNSRTLSMKTKQFLSIFSPFWIKKKKWKNDLNPTIVVWPLNVFNFVYKRIRFQFETWAVFVFDCS